MFSLISDRTVLTILAYLVLGLYLIPGTAFRLYLYWKGGIPRWRNSASYLFHISHITEGEDQNQVVVVRMNPLIPGWWRSYRADRPSRLEDMNVMKSGPAWRVIPHAYRYMCNKSVLDMMGEIDQERSSAGDRDDRV